MCRSSSHSPRAGTSSRPFGGPARTCGSLPKLGRRGRTSSLWAALALVALFAAGVPGVTQEHPRESISGIVRDGAGRPLAGARVGVIDHETAVMRETQTDEAGRFRVDGLTAAHPYRVVASKYGFLPQKLENVSPGDKEIVLRLSGAGPPAEPAPSVKRAPGGPSGSEDSTPALSLSAQLVLLNVSVRDVQGNPVHNLQKSNFIVDDDGEPQTISNFGEENAPLSVVLLVDTSSSMEGNLLQEAKRAAREFIDQSHPRNEIALIGFGDRVHRLQSFVEDRARIRAAVDQLTSAGGTALYDALFDAIESMSAARFPRHFVVLLTDGKDEDSRKRFGEVEQRVQSADVVIFAVGEYGEAERQLFVNGRKYYKDPAVEANLNPVWVLRELADLSGGSAYFPHPRETLQPFFARIARELHDQYLLGYVPPARPGPPKFHRIEVRVQGPPELGPLTVRTRQGYLGAGPQ